MSSSSIALGEITPKRNAKRVVNARAGGSSSNAGRSSVVEVKLLLDGKVGTSA